MGPHHLPDLYGLRKTPGPIREPEKLGVLLQLPRDSVSGIGYTERSLAETKVSGLGLMGFIYTKRAHQIFTIPPLEDKENSAVSGLKFVRYR